MQRCARRITRQDVLDTAQRFWANRGIDIDCSSGDAIRIAESWASALTPGLPISASFAVVWPDRILRYESGTGRTEACLVLRPDAYKFVLYDLTGDADHRAQLAEELRRAWPVDLEFGGPGLVGVAAIQPHARRLVGFIKANSR